MITEPMRKKKHFNLRFEPGTSGIPGDALSTAPVHHKCTHVHMVSGHHSNTFLSIQRCHVNKKNPTPSIFCTIIVLRAHIKIMISSAPWSLNSLRVFFKYEWKLFCLSVLLTSAIGPLDREIWRHLIIAFPPHAGLLTARWSNALACARMGGGGGGWGITLIGAYPNHSQSAGENSRVLRIDPVPTRV